MRYNGLGAASIVLSVLTIAVIIPYGLLTHTSLREDSLREKVRVIDSISKQQTTLLETLLKLQSKVDTTRASIEALSAPASEAETDDQRAARRKAIEDQYIELEASFTKQLNALEKETKQKFNDLKELIDARANRFLVKWHSDDGVKTSQRMATEQAAVDKFNDIGEFAKKLLMFDGSRWLVLKEYGGEKWLKLMHDDGEVQDGDGKPEKKADGNKDAEE